VNWFEVQAETTTTAQAPTSTEEGGLACREAQVLEAKRCACLKKQLNELSDRHRDGEQRLGPGGARGADLQLDVVITASAALYFQRFFLAERQGTFDAGRVAMACVWLATKVCEEACRLRDIVNAFLALAGQAEEGRVLQMEAYWALRDDVVLLEQAVLRAMAFDAEATMAYSHLAEIAWLLGCGQSETSGLVPLAWSLLNDAFCSEVCAAWTMAEKRDFASRGKVSGNSLQTWLLLQRPYGLALTLSGLRYPHWPWP